MYSQLVRDTASASHLEKLVLQVICKQEHAQRPCPRTILVLCTALCTNGLYQEGVFKEDAPSELVFYLLGAMQDGDPLFTMEFARFPVQNRDKLPLVV